MFTYNFDEIFNNLNRIFRDEDFFKFDDISRYVNTNVSIPMNIRVEEDGSNTVELAVPGMKRDDIKVTRKLNSEGLWNIFIGMAKTEETTTCTDDTSVTSGKQIKVYSPVTKIKNIFSNEKQVKIPVPANLDAEKCSVSVSDGLLTLKIPVKEEKKQPEPVEIEIK